MKLRAALTLVVSLLTAQNALCAELIPLDASGFRSELDKLENRVVLVNFWATWCRPCLEEIPLLMELEAELDPQDFALVAVSLDDAGSAESIVQPFVDKWFPNFRSYQSLEYDLDAMVSTIDPAWNEILPTSYIIARDGTIAELIQGARTKAEFLESIQTAMATAD
jgi:thiol-disulfide isomerase/thioredoxin